MIEDDTATTKSIVDTAYALISGRKGESRDWEKWRALHHPGARLIPIEGSGDQRVAKVMTPDEFITTRSAIFATMDFFEWETDRREEQCGTLAQVWSSYLAAHEPGGQPIRRGVNSIQLWNDGERWWILPIAWDAVEALKID
jgi:hypothetical protein